MKIILLLVFYALISLNVSAQALKAGFEHLKNNKLNEASKVFSKALSKGSETLAATYGMGCLLTTENYSQYNNVKGFRFLRMAYDRFHTQSLKTQNTCKNVYGFDQETIKTKMNLSAQKELDKVKAKNTLEDYQWFVDTFDGADSLVLEAKKLQAEIEIEIVKANPSFRAWKDFADKYAGTQYEEPALENYQKMWKDLCHDAYSEGELLSMNLFQKQYPDYPFYTAQDKAEWTLAETAAQLKMHFKYSTDYESYYTSYIDQAAPRELAYVALFRIISPYLEVGRYGEAISVLNKYKSKFPNREQDIEKVIAILKSPSHKFNSKPLPSTINTDFYEYAPVMTPDGSTLYFCGYNREDNIGNEDIFMAKFSDGQWQKAEIFPQFNTALGNEAPLAVSPDGNMLLIYKDSNIYYTEKSSKSWTPLKKMAALNTDKSWEADASFSPDGNAIFFISDRNGNVGHYHKHEKNFHGSLHGNTDIYVCTKNLDGTWNEPINIGNVINTPYSERSPILASDMKTLYFSSDGHYGLGKLDVFKAVRLSDTSWTQWSEPVNLGKEINTSEDDYNYIISTDGKTACFCKITSSTSNICTIDIPVNMRPEIIASVSGKVTDPLGKIIPATIKWEDLETGKLLGHLQCDPVTGKYFITLPAGKNYGYYVEYNGYYPVSGNLNTDKLKEGKNIEHNIIMNSIPDILTGKVSVRLSNIFFDTDKYDLKPESYPELNRLSDFIKNNPGITIEISGHTDNSGSPDYNKSLSQKRSDAVKNYLISIGCPNNTVKSVGYGSEKPVAQNSTEAGKALNRRVEFKIL